MRRPSDEPPGETPSPAGLFPRWGPGYEDHIANVNSSVKVIVVMDSGAVKNVLHLRQLPQDAEPTPPKDPDEHFVGANNARIDRYGECDTILEGPHCKIDCGWTLADVTRALHSVSTVCGPPGQVGTQDVLFNNNVCVVVPPGIVEATLNIAKPVNEYKRNGHLYSATMPMSSFHRRGQQ